MRERGVSVTPPDLFVPGRAEAPRWVRYAWADNPAVNLVNQAGLPAVPFEMAVKVGEAK